MLKQASTKLFLTKTKTFMTERWKIIQMNSVESTMEVNIKTVWTQKNHSDRTQ